jgi:hypothetical protein
MISIPSAWAALRGLRTRRVVSACEHGVRLLESGLHQQARDALLIHSRDLGRGALSARHMNLAFSVRYNLAIAELRMGQVEAAAQSLEALLALQSLPPVARHAAHCHAAIGKSLVSDAAAARSHLDAAARLRSHGLGTWTGPPLVASVEEVHLLSDALFTLRTGGVLRGEDAPGSARAFLALDGHVVTAVRICRALSRHLNRESPQAILADLLPLAQRNPAEFRYLSDSWPELRTFLRAHGA